MSRFRKFVYARLLKNIRDALSSVLRTEVVNLPTDYARDATLRDTLPRESRLYLYDPLSSAWKPARSEPDGSLPVTVKNAEIMVGGISAEAGDSILVYGKDPSTGSVYPIVVDSQGKVRVKDVESAVDVVVIDEPAYDASADLKKVSIERDNVGVAKDATLQKIVNALESVGADRLLVVPDNPPNLDVAISTRASESTQQRILAIDEDISLRRSGGRLLAVVDFTVDDLGLGSIIVVGASSYSIVDIQSEGIPMPEGTGSSKVLKIVVSAGSTVYVRVPIKARFYVPFSAYVTVYNKDYEMEYSFYISLGGYYTTGTRQKPPKRLRLPANQWGRFVTHWFMEAHHGCAEVDIEIYNPNSVDVTVYVGIVTACEIFPHIKGHCLLVGWEGNFYVPLSNETFDWYVDVMLPTDVGEVMNLWVGMGIQSDDGTTITGEIYFHPGGRLLVSASTTSSASASKDFKVWCGRHGFYGYQTFTLEFKVSTTGSGRITYLQVVFRCFSKENSYQKWFEGTVSANSTVTVVDFWNDVSHVKGGRLTITAPSDGDVEVYGVTPEGTIVINKVKAGQTQTIEIVGRYHFIQLKNLSTTASASYQGWLEISESIITE